MIQGEIMQNYIKMNVFMYLLLFRYMKATLIHDEFKDLQ